MVVRRMSPGVLAFSLNSKNVNPSLKMQSNPISDAIPAPTGQQVKQPATNQSYDCARRVRYVKGVRARGSFLKRLQLLVAV